MGISYPASVDTFPVPTLPEGTSLSSAGTANRAHTDHHRDLGLGLTAVMTNAALKTHLHAGTVGDLTAKLPQTNTHEGVDTDTNTGIHHTLGTGANQSARGNHTHVIDLLWKRCTSSTRPPSPQIGDFIYETDTHHGRVWDQMPGMSAPAWCLCLGSMPTTRLRQNTAQQLSASGSIVNWDEEVEDTFDYWSSADKPTVHVREAGVYQIEAALQWDSGRVPDVAYLILCVNGVETNIRKQQFMRGNIFVPGFSQTLAVSGKLRFAANDTLSVKARYVSPSGFIGFLLSFIDGPEKIKSRLDVVYVGP